MENTVSVLTEGTIEKISLLKQLSNNRTYLYIIAVVIVLAGIGYYLYKTQFSKKPENKKSTDIETENKKEILNPNKEYYILDRRGNPILVNQYFNNMLEASQQKTKQPIMLNQSEPKLEKPQPYLKQQTSRPKLSHPGEDEKEETNYDNEQEKDEEYNEDEDIANQDLTQDEIEELNRQLDMMQRKKSSQITAENDIDDDDEKF